ncbi:MAG: DUF3048 domain-containing protein [Actinomycetota bacterium]|nr:DUF3048 domain-containing protein [Actinomycetota bacterium]
MTLSRRGRIVAIGGGVVGLAAIVFVVLLITKPSALRSVPVVGEHVAPPTCPLTGEKPKNEKLLDRPALAVKVENNPAAYPLSGLEKADMVFEEVVEGGLSRFMAIYHCGDSSSVGPVRSTRIVDPELMIPATKILADAGGNGIVLEHLKKEGIVSIDENSAGSAMHRADRAGYSFEHTLYGNTTLLRKLGQKKYSDPPPDGYFNFGDLPSGGKKGKSISMTFESSSSTIGYTWQGGHYLRTDSGNPLVSETNGGKQIAVDNVIVEFHTVDLSTKLSDVVGTPSPLIKDFTGSNKAVLFRDGKAFVGKWERASIDDSVKFVTKSGDDMVLHTGTTWIELLPDKKGEVSGTLTY